MRYFRYTIVWSFVLLVVLIGPALLAQVTGEVLNEGRASTGNEWGNSFLWAMASTWLLRIARENPKLSGFTQYTTLTAQRLVGAAVGFFSGLGITFVFDQEAGQLVIGGLFLNALFNGVRQFLFQEFIYHSALKRPTPAQ